MAKMSEKTQKLFDKIMDNWQAVNDVSKGQREQAIEDLQFAHIAGSQWDDIASKAREGKPKYEINRIAPAINLIVGTQRQNKIGMKVRPLNNGATKDIAKTYNGLNRNIENRSKFDNIQNQAFKEIVTGGYGAWQVSTGYSNDQSFEQDISIKGIPSAANSVYFDNGSIDENHRDANWCFVIADIPVAEFEKKYPKSTPTSVSDGLNTEYNRDWCNTDKNTVRIADYWFKEPRTIEIAQLSDRRVIELNDDSESVLDELANPVDPEEQPVTVIKTRKIKTHRVVHYVVSGAEILEGRKEWAGLNIPVVLTYGYNIWIDGIRYVRGIVRMAKDSQRIYNYSRSAIIEATALAKKDPTWLTAEEVKGFEDEVGKDKPIQLYNSVPNGRGPLRTGAPSVQSALIEQANQANDDVKTTTGLFDPSLGNNPANQSGKAIEAQQAQGDLGTFELADNLVKSVEYTAEILIDLLPRIYDTERQETIINEDGSEEVVMINQTVRDEKTGKDIILNDLSLGKYGVVASNGASFATKRTEMLNTLVSLGANDPNFAQVSSDLVAKNLDFPFADELSERLRKPMVANGIIEPNEEEAQKIQEQQPQGPSEAEVLLLEEQKFKVSNLAADQDKKVAERNKTEAETNKTIMETNKIISETIKNKADADKTINETLDEGGQPVIGLDPLELAVMEDNTAMVHENLEEDSPLHEEEQFQQEELIEQPIDQFQQESVIEQPLEELPLNDLDLQNQQI